MANHPRLLASLNVKPWFLVSLVTLGLGAAEIGVGPGKGFVRIEDALAQAEPGDTVVIYARGDGSPYRKTALRISKPRIALRGELDGNGKPPLLDGSGGSYAGTNKVPRAIIEFGPEAEGGSVSGLHLANAHNASHNAAGVRIDAANDVTVTACRIESCDLGVFSNGAAAGNATAMQRLTVRDCTIRRNGDPSQPDMSHNLYLGGSSARVVGCLIEESTSGHNLKSRLGQLLVEACLIRHAAHRELDLVDAPGVTDQAGGFALVLGCQLIKDPACGGNRSVIHWGQDGGADRLGNLYLVHCTVITPFAAPVIELSAPGAQVSLANDLICGPDGAPGARTLVARRGPGLAEPLSAAGVWLSGNYAPGPPGKVIMLGQPGAAPPVHTEDWRPVSSAGPPLIDGAIPLGQLALPISALHSDHPLRQRPPRLLRFSERGAVDREVVGSGLDLGASEASPGH